MVATVTYDPNNIFAKILRGEIPCEKLLEDDFFMVFEDKFPKAPIHALVIPKGYYKDVFDFNNNASSAELEGFYRGISQTISHLGLCSTGCRIISNMGDHGQQEVMHYHVHILAGKRLGAKIVA